MEGGHQTRATAAQDEYVNFKFFVHEMLVILQRGGKARLQALGLAFRERIPGTNRVDW